MPTEAKIRQWFDRSYSQNGLKSMRSREAYPVFLDYLGVEKGKTFLDLGCGTGFLLSEAQQRGLKTYGVDLSPVALELCREVSPQSRIKLGTGEHLEFEDNFFDYVTCIGTLEHFLDMSRGLQEMRRVSAQDALFCIMVPNRNSGFWKIATASGVIEEDSNENAWSIEEWSELFCRNGFEVIKVYRDRWYVKKLLSLVGLGSSVAFARAIMAVLRPVVPLRNANQFVFLLRKAPG